MISCAGATPIRHSLKMRPPSGGGEGLVQSSKSDETLQASQVENMLIQGIAVLVLTPVNAAAAQGIVRNATKAGVPMINCNVLIEKAVPSVSSAVTPSRWAKRSSRQRLRPI